MFQELLRQHANPGSYLHNVIFGFDARARDNRLQHVVIDQKMLPKVGIEADAVGFEERGDGMHGGIIALFSLDFREPKAKIPTDAILPSSFGLRIRSPERSAAVPKEAADSVVFY